MVTRSVRMLTVAATLFATGSCSGGPNLTSGTPRVAARSDLVDYGDPDSWLCRPGREDACAVDLTATVILEDGTTSIEQWPGDPNAEIDCFYVYPTVSQQETPNSTLEATFAEMAVATAQAARFRSECRVFAPLYRQMTLAALRSGLGADPSSMNGALEIAYGDVRAAWNEYLDDDNEGRGVVLIGHSQGSILLQRLIQEEIEQDPIRSRIVSALLLGWNVLIPEGGDVGGTFEVMPVCRSSGQTGCVVTYVSFREEVPPAPDAIFARSPIPGMTVACTHPATLAPGPAPLNGYLAADRQGLPPWTDSAQEISTLFVRVPNLLVGECVSNEHGSYLSISVNAQPGPRTDVIGGDIPNADGSVNDAWGLHLIDVQAAIGDLVDLVGEQARSFAASAPR